VSSSRATLAQLAVVVPQAQGRLLAIGGLAAHLDTADRAEALALDDPLELGRPPPVPDADVLRHADTSPGLETGLRGCG